MKAKQLRVSMSDTTQELKAVVYDLPYDYMEGSFRKPSPAGSYAVPATKDNNEAFEELKSAIIEALESEVARIHNNIKKIKALVLEEL